MAALRTLFETPAKARMSAQSYIDDPLSERKSDIIEGVFVMASPASFLHEDIQSFILTTLRLFVDSLGSGKVMGPNTAYRLSEENVFQPDISFIAIERLHLAEDVYFPGPPDIAIEIVSPSSRHYDTIEKKINYARYGVREYWLIDPIDETVTFFRQINGELLPIPDAEGVARSEVLQGYWLDRLWLFPSMGSIMPNTLEVARLQGLI